MASNMYVSDVNKYYKVSYNLDDILQIKSIQETIIKRANSPALTYSFNNDCKITLTTPNGDVILTTSVNEDIEYKFSVLGSYIIRYSGTIQQYNRNNQSTLYEDFNIAFYIAVVENKLPLKKWTITSVLNRLLDVCEPLRKGEKPRFRLQGMKADGTYEEGSQADKFDQIPAPQFSFTKQTLRECLQDVGKVVHGEPRLEPKKDEDGVWYYEVSYEMFVQQKKSGIYTRPYLKETVSQVIDSYAAWIDSNAENLVNQLDKFSGVIVEPYAGGAKTVRTENAYVRIEEGNMLIATAYPIYTVDKLEYLYVKDGAMQSVDITPWLFEKSVYDTQLSSYEEQYPYSKAYGLYFTQGGKNIGGLNFKVDAAVFAPFRQYAIVNILQQATGNSELKIENYPGMCFRVTYTPFYNARVAQTKVNYKDFKSPAALIYNQSANVIESRYYGENLKGVIARTGNIDLSLTYHLARPRQVPQAGQMYDENYYISSVATEYLPNLIKCTIGLSKDFNRLSAYIGINSEKRYSEISQGQAVERNTLWREYIVVGEKELPDADLLIDDKMMQSIAAVFTQGARTETFTNGRYYIGANFLFPFDESRQYTVYLNGETYTANVVMESNNADDEYYLVLNGATASGTGEIIMSEPKPLTNVTARGSSYKGNYNAAVNLPVISSAFGNSISFSWKYEDNYSAGAQAVYQKNGEVLGYWQQSFNYTDYYGRIYYYDFDLQPAGEQPTAETLETLGQKLPQGKPIASFNRYISTFNKPPYVLRKDNREALQCNFQIDFVTNSDIIIGSALASYCPAVRGTDIKLKAKLYVFPTELNKFTDHLEAYEEEKLSELASAEVSIDGISPFAVTAASFPASGKSWAIVTNQTIEEGEDVEDEFGKVDKEKKVTGGDLLIGRNIEVTAGQAFTPIYFTPKREIFDKTVWKDRR